MVLLTPYFMEPNQADPMRARMDEYGQIVKELAAQYGLPCVDTQAAWDGLFRRNMVVEVREVIPQVVEGRNSQIRGKQ